MKQEKEIKIGDQIYEAKAGKGSEYSGNATTTVSVDNLLFKMDKSSSISYKVTKEMEHSRFTDMLKLNSISKKNRTGNKIKLYLKIV